MHYHSIIQDTEYHLPEKVIKNIEFYPNISKPYIKKLENKVGILERHVAGCGETALDLAYKCCLKLFSRNNKSEIDSLIFVTQSPDYLLPSNSCILQNKLQLSKNTAAFDINLGCSGFVYGVACAKGLIASGVANNVLLVTSDTYSKHLGVNDHIHKFIFGDGAAATLIKRSKKNGITDFILGTDGSGYNKLILKKSGLRNKNFNDENDKNNFFMDGPEIFNFTLKVIPKLFNDFLKKNSINIQNVDLVIFHQANKFMLKKLEEKIKIPSKLNYINLKHYGNTVSSTIPICIKDAKDQGKIKAGSKVIICGFGVGLSWGIGLIEF